MRQRKALLSNEERLARKLPKLDSCQWLPSAGLGVVYEVSSDVGTHTNQAPLRSINIEALRCD